MGWRMRRRRLLEAAGLLGGRPFDYYVDSVNGSDDNDGLTQATAFATIGKLGTIAAGKKIGLAKGSTWKEQLTIGANNVTVAAYGTGDKPIIDCADVIATDDWSKSDGLTNVYQCTKSPALDAADTFPGIFEDGTPLIRLESTATCDSTPGSFTVSSETVAPCTLYVHPTGSTDPSSNGKTYEFTSRQNAIAAYGYTGVTVRGIHGKRCLQGSGNFRMGNNATLIDCLSTWGCKHNFYIGEGSVLVDCVATDIREYDIGLSGTMYVYNSNSPNGGGVTFTRCTAQCTAYNAEAMGFYGHHNVDGDYGTILFQDCAAINCGNGAFSGINAAFVINNPTVTNCLYAFWPIDGMDSLTLTGGTFTTSANAARCLYHQAPSCPVIITDLTVIHTGTVSGASLYIASGVAPELTLSNVSLTLQPNGVFMRAYNNNGGAINVSGCDFLGSSTDGSVYMTVSGGPDITSDNNRFGLGTYNFTIDGTAYTDVATYKTATGQDANSTIG